MRRRSAPRWLPPVLVVAVDAVLLLGALAVGLRVPAVRIVASGLPAGSELDYVSRVGPLSGLSAQFVARVLGWERRLRMEAPRTASSPSAPRIELGPGDVQAKPEQGLSGADIHAPTNDHFENARPLADIPYEASTSSGSATRQHGEPSGCAPPVGGTLWYRFTPKSDVGLIADTMGSDHATALAVYSGTSLADVSMVGCDSHPKGMALVAFPAKAGETFFFQVGLLTQEAGSLLGTDVVFSLRRQGITSLASVGTDGQANWESDYAAISADGRHVAFRSGAGNLDERFLTPLCPSNHYCGQIFVRDLVGGRTRLVSISSTGEPGNGPSGFGLPVAAPALSADGRHVAFLSYASNLVPGDTNICPGPGWADRPTNCPDVFVHDRDADADGTFDEDPREQPGAVSTTRVNVSTQGEQANANSGPVTISADGRYVAFGSLASNLVPGDDAKCDWLFVQMSCLDVFVHDRETRETTMVSLSSDEQPGNDDSAQYPYAGGVSISAEGRYVAFTSRASNLVPDDTVKCEEWRSCSDVFVRDRVQGTTVKISQAQHGASVLDSHSPSISASGRYVAFASAVQHHDPAPDGPSHVIVHDRDADRDSLFDEGDAVATGMVSVTIRGSPSNAASWDPVISNDGRYVAFVSGSSDLVPNDTNAGTDLFLRDLWRERTIRISVSSAGSSQAGGNHPSRTPGMSGDASVFTWFSDASDLVSDDRHPSHDVFVHHLEWR